MWGLRWPQSVPERDREKDSTMDEKVSAGEMQGCNNTIINAKGSIEALARVLFAAANEPAGKEYTEYEVSPLDAARIGATMLFMLAERLESAIVTTDHARAYGCVGTCEARAE